MKRFAFKEIRKVRILFFAMFVTFAAGCSFEPSGKEADGASSSDQKTGVNSLEAFKQTVYPLVRSKTCVGCHKAIQTPFFADDDAVVAHQVLITAGKVDFVSPENSRLVERLGSDKHNCWSSDCEADAKVMLKAIESWIGLMTPSEDKEEPKLITGELKITDLVEKEGVEADSKDVVLKGEDATLIGAFRIQEEGASVVGRSIGTPRMGITYPIGNSTGAVAKFDINVETAGNYYLWAMLRGPTTNDNSFFVRVDSVPFVEWHTAITFDKWAWDIAKDAGRMNILRFDLTAGSHVLEIKAFEDGASLDTIALTLDPNFDGSEISIARKVLRFDLSDLTGKADTYLEIEASQFDEHSYLFNNPTIITKEAAISVKDVRVLVNGKYDPQTATYTVIDQEVTAPGGIISGAALLVPMASGADGDKISISFGELRVK